MISSFLNALLPEDEHKRLKIVYFLAEAAFFTTLILLFIVFLNNFLNVITVNSSVIMIGIPFVITIYVYIRYIISGVEFTEVASKADYQKQRRKSFRNAIRSGLIFAFAFFIIKGVPKSGEEILDLIMLPLFFACFSYLFDSISLKRSYKKNKGILDD